MIKKLKKKFIILASVSMLVLMTVLVLVMNLVNYRTVVAESDKVLHILKESSERMDDGLPPDGPGRDWEDEAWEEGDWDERVWEGDMRGQGELFGLSPEAQYEARFFVADISEDGQVVHLDTSRIISVDSDDAKEYIQKALGTSKEKGFIGDFRFIKTDSEEDEGMKIIFLDCGRRLAAFHRFMLISILMGAAGCIIVFLVFLFAAGRIIRPIAESYEKQKRFITDAGHEIKTPLTIISANVDLLREDVGENESIDDIAEQTERLSELTKDLVFLSKMEEPDRQLVKVDFPVSDLVSETAASFTAVAQAQKKEYQINVQPSLTMNGAPEEIRRLASILIENAMKYSPEGGSVKVNLEMQKKNIVLSVFNTTFEPMAQQDLSRLFERFYRTDASRNSETGGHGIGLSIAKAITENHGGKITASTSGGSDFCITAVLPQ